MRNTKTESQQNTRMTSTRITLPFLHTLREYVEEIGALLMTRQKSSDLVIQKKGDGTVVTDADIAASQLLITWLQARRPFDTIISEEAPPKKGTSHVCWYIDPLDGTNEYIEHKNDFCIAIGAFRKKNPLLSILFFPVEKRMYWAFRKKGAYKKYAEKSIPIQFFERKGERIRSHPVRCAQMPFPTSQTRTLRNIASILEGKFEAYVSINVKTWDILPAATLISEAGGTIMNFSGETLKWKKEVHPEIICGHLSACTRVHQMLKSIHEAGTYDLRSASELTT